jgi:hypothetical protein
VRFANARDKTWILGDHCARVRVMRRIGWLKRVSPPNCTLSFIIFVFVYTTAGGRLFSCQPPAVVGPFRVVLVK